jgi:hypothetical protein
LKGIPGKKKLTTLTEREGKCEKIWEREREREERVLWGFDSLFNFIYFF